MARSYLFTSESVTEGHPDKLADRISDAILDAIMAEDPQGRVACETLVTTGQVIVAGEITTDTYIEARDIVRSTVNEVGYTNAKYGLDGSTCGVLLAIQGQSPDIALGVDTAYEAKGGAEDDLDTLGAGDQGMMFGFAVKERPDLDTELMPTPIWLAHRLAHRLSQERKSGRMPYLRPDGKTQVSIRYEDGVPVGIENILISAQHEPEVDIETLLKPDLMEYVVKPIVPDCLWSDDIEKSFLVNPTGRFEIGGPMGDTGLTGRKIIVDTYGGFCSHGGGAFSGKDPTKVDRTGAYFARYVAKNLVASEVMDACEIRVAYAIGVAHPVSISLDDRGTAKVDPNKLEKLVGEFFDFRPAAIIRDLDLRKPIFKDSSSYGHFGRTEKHFSWERTDRAEEFAKSAADL